MEDIILDILDALRRGETVDDAALVKLVNARARRTGADKRAFAKRRLLPYCQRVRSEEPERWASWGVTPELEERLFAVLRMKPRRSASGVATITVITKPWPCGSDCLYCPSDVRMPKSYLADEPACARAELNAFDPYLQVSARLTALSQMGHATDKIELIVLGGTWSDYPAPYQTWFVTELFRALNDDARAGVAANPALAAPGQDAGAVLASEDDLPPGVVERRARYRACGIAVGPRTSRDASEGAGDPGGTAHDAARFQRAVDDGALTYNGAVRELYGASPAWCAAARWQVADMADLERAQRANETAAHRVVGLVIETRPDAVSPASLALIRRMGATKVQMGVQSTCQRILDLNDRGISVGRIREAFSWLRLFGFKTNLRQMVEERLRRPGPDGARREVREIRFREVGTSGVDVGALSLDVVPYETDGTSERFLQWVDPEGRIAGFLRLSLPDPALVARHAAELPVAPGEAMIREVHVYGMATRVGAEGRAAQHLGLGRALVERACELARDAGYDRINVISAVGTREYYRQLGFTDHGLYQQRRL